MADMRLQSCIGVGSDGTGVCGGFDVTKNGLLLTSNEVLSQIEN